MDHGSVGTGDTGVEVLLPESRGEVTWDKNGNSTVPLPHLPDFIESR